MYIITTHHDSNLFLYVQYDNRKQHFPVKKTNLIMYD